MTLNEFLDWMDDVRPSPWSHEQKALWVNDLESSLWSQILLAPPGAWRVRTAARDGEKPLLLPESWRKLYAAYVGAMMDFAAGENAAYANSMALYNGYLAELGAWYAGTFEPAKRGPVWLKAGSVSASGLGEEALYLGQLPPGSAVLAAECRVTEAFDTEGSLCLGTEEEPALYLAADAGAEGLSRSMAMTLPGEEGGLYLTYTGEAPAQGAAELRLFIQPGPKSGHAAPASWSSGFGGTAGRDGKSAYAYAVAGGYTGTEEEFAAKLAREDVTVHVGSGEPAEEEICLWIDPDEDGEATAVPPDWSQNDETQPDYVANRTHWMENTETETEYLPLTAVTTETKTNGKNMGTINVSVPDVIVDGERYRVTFDGVLYDLTASGNYVGNRSVQSTDYEDTGEPFVLRVSSYLPYLWTAEAGEHTIAVVHVTESVTYHKLDINYLPLESLELSVVTADGETRVYQLWGSEITDGV